MDRVTLGHLCGRAARRRTAVGGCVALLAAGACARSGVSAGSGGHDAAIPEVPDGEPPMSVALVPPADVDWRMLNPTDDGLPRTVQTFCMAKGELAQLYADHRETFLCGCEFAADMTASLDRCGYRPKASSPRAHRVEWRHIVPVEILLAHRPCWSEPICTKPTGEKFKGITCCEKADRIYNKMVADLHDIAPELGEISDFRGARTFGDVPGEAREFGGCDFEIDPENDVAEPPASRRGDIARAYLYMHHVYGDSVPLTDAELRRFEGWHAMDPPTEWERERNRRIAKIQGSRNPLVE
jgi:deoxyribonuclease I